MKQVFFCVLAMLLSGLIVLDQSRRHACIEPTFSTPSVATHSADMACRNRSIELYHSPMLPNSGYDALRKWSTGQACLDLEGVTRPKGRRPSEKCTDHQASAWPWKELGIGSLVCTHCMSECCFSYLSFHALTYINVVLISTTSSAGLRAFRKTLVDAKFRKISCAGPEVCEIDPLQYEMWENGMVYSMHFSGQFQQDRFVFEQVYGATRVNGYFVDVGANDGLDGSNTLVLAQRYGWHGLCVEASPGNVQQLRIVRQDCKVVEAAVVAKPGYVRLKKGGSSSQLTSVSGSDATDANSIVVHGRTLFEILQTSSSPRFIEFLSLDIEGAELVALQSMDFSYYTFGVIAVEHNFDRDKRDNIRTILEANGYMWVHGGFCADPRCIAEWADCTAPLGCPCVDDYFLPRGTHAQLK